MHAHRLGALGVSVIAAVSLAGCGTATGESGAGPSSQLAEFSVKTEYQRISPTDPPLTPATTKAGGAAPKGTWKYQIVANDHLYGIAKKAGTTCKAEDIATANAWPEGVQHVIHVGNEIIMPATCDATVVVTPPANSAPPVGTSPGGAVTAGGTYTIQPNDTLYGIAKKTGTSLDAILEVNGWTGKEPSKILIYKGMVIKLPGKG